MNDETNNLLKEILKELRDLNKKPLINPIDATSFRGLFEQILAELRKLNEK